MDSKSILSNAVDAALVTLAIAAPAAWITHIVWAIAMLASASQSAGQIVLAFIGLVLPPIGMIHGFMIWFGFGV